MNDAFIQSEFIRKKLEENGGVLSPYIGTLFQIHSLLIKIFSHDPVHDPEKAAVLTLKYPAEWSGIFKELEAQKRAERETYRETGAHEDREKVSEKHDTVERYRMFLDKSGLEVKDGPYARINMKTGLKIEDGEYKNGNRHGVWTYYYGSGEKWFECEYCNGERNGIYSMWDKNGKFIERKLYRNDKEIPAAYCFPINIALT